MKYFVVLYQAYEDCEVLGIITDPALAERLNGLNGIVVDEFKLNDLKEEDVKKRELPADFGF